MKSKKKICNRFVESLEKVAGLKEKVFELAAWGRNPLKSDR
jgi:hypothetical protein